MTSGVPYYRKFLSERLASRVRKNARYSLRSFAQNLGVSAGTISQILNGTRSPSARLIERFFAATQPSSEEKAEFIRSLFEEKKSQGKKRISPKIKRAAERASSSPSPILAYGAIELDRFHLIADWYHLAIWEMSARRDFDPSPQRIAQKLRISVIEAKQALDRLEEAGLIVKFRNTYKKTKNQIQTSDLKNSTQAHRKHQAQMLEKAAFALETVPIENRFHGGIIMNIDPARIGELREKVQAALWKIAESLSGDAPSQVYQVGLQIFPLETVSSPKGSHS